MTVTEKQIANCVGYYRRLLDARPASLPESLAQATRSGLQQIIVRAGAKRRSAGLLAALEDAFADAGIVTYPRLSDPKNRPDQRIHFFDRRNQLKDVSTARYSFPDEDSLRQFILANLHEFDELRGLTGIQVERKMPSGRRLDIVARRSRLHELVGIELKLNDIDDRAVGQSLKYIDDLAKEGERQGLSAHYVLLAGGQPKIPGRNQIQRHADERGVALTVLLYSVEMKLRPHP